MDSRFGTAVCCIDGRIQAPVAAWLKAKYLLDYVDMVTEPGADAVLAGGPPELQAQLRAKVQTSLERHGSTVLAVAGHHDCAAAPGTKEDHAAHITRALEVVRGWGLSATVEGLWVNDQWEVEAL